MMFCRSLTVSEAVGSERHFCKIKPRPSSSRSHLHCSTRLILYTLSADNVRKTCEARSSCSLLSNFVKKQSFRIAIRALMQGRCRPIMGARSAWNLLSFRISFPISDCSFSNFDRRVGVSIPYSVHYSVTTLGMYRSLDVRHVTYFSHTSVYTHCNTGHRNTSMHAERHL